MMDLVDGIEHTYVDMYYDQGLMSSKPVYS